MPKKADDLLERTLPHNLEAERAVLGAVMLHGDTLTTAMQVIGERDFYRDAHRRIFSAMVRIHDTSGSIDMVTIRNELARLGDLDECGGPAYLSALVDGIPRSTNIRQYAHIVKEKAMLRSLIFASNKTITRAYLAEDKAASILSDADRGLAELQAGSGGEMVALSRSTDGLLTDLEYRVAHKGQLTGVDTGFKRINDITSGWQAGDLVIVAARPSIGKTTFAVNSGMAGARSGKRVAIFSLEMKRKQLEYRLLSSMCGVGLSALMGGYLNEKDYARLSHGISEMGRLPMSIDDTAARTAWQIRTTCRQLKAEGGLDLVIVDYVQLMPGTLERRGATRNEEVTDISRRLKEMAGELGVTMMVLSQLNRGSDGRADSQPRLSDLRESGSLEQDADLVCFLHRKHHREGGETVFIVEKQRNGPTGSCNLSLERETTTFTDGPDESAAPVAQKEAPEAAKLRRQHFARKGN